jgi:molecular chaperone GrpE (heat shock protein)
MPIPEPQLDETEKDFITRCMIDNTMVSEYKDEKQRSAVCYSSWEESKQTNLADIKELFNNKYTKIENVEILNKFPNAHKINFTDEDLQEYVKNYNELKDSGELIPNVKVSHSDQQLILREYFKMNDVEFGEELPNLGLLDNIRVVDGRLRTDIVKIPEVLSNIYKDAYSTISPEIVPNWQGTGKEVIRGIVLTNNPSQKHISDVHMSAGTLNYGGNPIIIKGGEAMGEDKIDVKTVLEDEGFVTKLADKITNIFKKDKDVDKVDVDKGKTDKDENVVQMSVAQFTELKSEMNELKAKLIEKDEQTLKFSSDVQNMKERAKKEQAEAICSKALGDGVPKVVIDKLKPLLLSDIEVSEKGEQIIKLSRMVDDKEVIAEKSIADIVKDVFANYPGERVDFSDRTITELSAPSDDKMKKVKTRAAELQKSGMSEHDALMKAGEELI